MKGFSVIALFASVVGAFAAPSAEVEKREADITHTGQGTWFDVGLGACGATSTNDQPVVAISSQIYGSGGNCFQWIKITANGVTAYGQVVDECPGCGEYSLDLSPSLFEQFADLSVGVIDISWNYEPFGFSPPSF